MKSIASKTTASVAQQLRPSVASAHPETVVFREVDPVGAMYKAIAERSLPSAGR